MSRKDDLERLIRDSCDIIHQYEEIVQTSDRPEEKARARRNIEEQRALIRGHLAEYQTLCHRLGRPLADDILEIGTTLEAGDSAAGPREAPVTPDDLAGRDQLIGVGPREQGVSGSRRAEEPKERERISLRAQLEAARENLLIIRERKSQYVMETDVPLDLIKRERQLEQQIAELEAQLAPVD